MGNLCSPNIAAQVDLFLCVLPACLVEHSCLIYADICVKYLELFLLHHEYRVSGEAHEARKCLHQCHRTCYFCSWHCYRAQGKAMLFHLFVLNPKQYCICVWAMACVDAPDDERRAGSRGHGHALMLRSIVPMLQSMVEPCRLHALLNSIHD